MTYRPLPPVLLALAAAIATIAVSRPAAAEESATLVDAVTAGETHVALRYRFEHVDQDGFAEDADASTLRLRLNHLTAGWRGWRAFGEFDYVGELFFDDFNSGGGTSPGRTSYPLVADPNGADLNQLYADYDARGWRLRLGRQRILLDDERFVGGVGWRQNEQTFDAVSATGKAGKSEVFYAWIGNANRIFGDTVAVGDHRMSTHLLHARLPIGARLSLTPYAYYIDNDDDPAASTATFGLRAGGTLEAGSGAFAWLAELATQSDAANAPVEFDARYWHLDARWQPANGNLPAAGLGVASLGGDRTASGAAFRTPLATLHAFQGWADQFLVTPDAGIVDIYGSLSYGRGNWQLEAIYHDFAAEDASASFGRELDLVATRRFGSRYAATLKAAVFDGEPPAFADTAKAWLMLTAAY